MKKLIFIIGILCISNINAQKTNLAPSKPVTDKYFETNIVDEYRNLENIEDTQTLNWMRSQTAYTNSVLELIPKKDYYLQKRLEIDKRQGNSISHLKISGNNKYFYLKKKVMRK